MQCSIRVICHYLKCLGSHVLPPVRKFYSVVFNTHPEFCQEQNFWGDSGAIIFQHKSSKDLEGGFKDVYVKWSCKCQGFFYNKSKKKKTKNKKALLNFGLNSTCHPRVLIIFHLEIFRLPTRELLK